jgi:hypothetical protein
MSLGAAVFASVVLVLAVYHKGFRKVLLWTGAVAAALALLAAACYFAYDRYSTWQADREVQRQKAVIAEGVKDCMLRLGTPMPKAETTPDSQQKDYFNNLTACKAYPDVDVAARMGPGFEGGTLPPGYTLDPKGKVTPIPPPPAGLVPEPASAATTRLPPGATVRPLFDMSKAKPIQSKPVDLSGGFAPKPKKEPGLEATITCDVVVYDRDMFAGGNPEAITSVHTGDTVQYVGHVTVGDQEIIRVHGRKGYVSGCVDVKQ